MQEALAPIIPQFSVQEADFFPSYPLSRLTTLRIGGPCELLAVPKTEAALLRLLSLLRDAGIPRVILGNGSNILAPDEGYRGVVIKTTALREVRLADDVICAASGAPLTSLVQAANAAGIGGLSSLCGIPATVGGAAFMNAGAFGSTFGDAVREVRVAPASGGPPFLLSRGECDFSYRKSIFQARTLTVLSVRITGPSADPARLAAEAARVLSERRERHPAEYPNAGSIFRRPAVGYAGKMIEEAGLSGFCIGGAEVSRKHAGFIVNKGGATANDVRTLIAEIQSKVYERTGVFLVREIEYLGE